MAARLRAHRSDNIWPGFVDALATLLLVIMFLLVMFVLAHVFLSQALSGRDEALERLNSQISELANLLALEQQTSVELRSNVTQLSASLQESTKGRDALNLEIEILKASLAETQSLLSNSESQAADNNESRDGYQRLPFPVTKQPPCAPEPGNYRTSFRPCAPRQMKSLRSHKISWVVLKTSYATPRRI